MFWSGGRLERELPNIVTNYDPRKIDCASYTLSIGREVYVSPDGEREFNKVVKLNRDETFEIPSGQFAYILTDEIISIPRNVLAFINTKSKLKLRGLVNISGFHVDPGYHGRIIFSLYNAGPSGILLKQGDSFGLIWFCNTDNETKDFYKKTDGFNSIGAELVTQVPGSNLTLEVLNKKIAQLETKLIAGVIVVVLPLVVSTTIALTQVIYDHWLK